MIPPSIFNLSSFSLFSVSINKLQGTLPANLGIAFPSLEYLGLNANQFSGSIPGSISNASNLVHLAISENQLHGKVPSLHNLCRLERTIFSVNNRLEMGEFILAANNLGDGGISDLSFVCGLTNSTGLRVLSFSVNKFGGILPHCIGNLTSSLSYTSILVIIKYQAASQMWLEIWWTWRSYLCLGTDFQVSFPLI